MTKNTQFVLSAGLCTNDPQLQLEFVSDLSARMSQLGAIHIRPWTDKEYVHLDSYFPHAYNALGKPYELSVIEFVALEQAYDSERELQVDYVIGFDSPDEVEGFVYLMDAKGSGRVKIGKSVAPLDRARQLNRGQSPYPIQHIYQVGASMMSRAEDFLHRAFDRDRVHGEWFQLSGTDIELIKTVRFM